MDNSTTTTLDTDERSATRYEQDHVHQVYEAIASHFSQTRYKPWPLVADFLSDQPVGSIGLDAGSGNGKYLHGHNITSRPKPATIPIGAKDPQLLLHQEPRYCLIGLDRSLSLLSFASNAHSDPELLHADCLRPPIRQTFAFDFAISIATLHHFSTTNRRCEAMQSLLSAIRPVAQGRTGRLLVFVWAYEQGEQSRRKLEKGTLLRAQNLPHSDPESLHITSEIPVQDVLVPWVTSRHLTNESSLEVMSYNRYYHLFHEGELVELVHKAASRLGLVDRSQSAVTLNSQSTAPTYYQIFRNGWEADNWWVEVRVG